MQGVPEPQADLLSLPGPHGAPPCLHNQHSPRAWSTFPLPSVPPSASAAAPCWLGRGQLASYSVLPSGIGEGRGDGKTQEALPWMSRQLMGFPRPVPNIFRKKNSGTCSSLWPRLAGEDLSEVTQQSGPPAHTHLHPQAAGTEACRERSTLGS